MKRVIALVVVFGAVAGCLTLLIGGVQASGAQSAGEDSKAKPKPKPYEMVADLYVVMGYVDDIFNEMPDKVKANRTRKVSTEAMFLAELANISTYAKDWRGEKGWLEYMTTMKNDFLEMSKVAKKKDKDAVNALHKKITNTCDTCHDKIRDA